MYIYREREERERKQISLYTHEYTRGREKTNLFIYTHIYSIYTRIYIHMYIYLYIYVYLHSGICTECGSNGGTNSYLRMCWLKAIGGGGQPLRGCTNPFYSHVYLVVTIVWRNLGIILFALFFGNLLEKILTWVRYIWSWAQTVSD